MALQNILEGDSVNTGRGKINTNNAEVNTHLGESNPHGTTAADIGALTELGVHQVVDRVSEQPDAQGDLLINLASYRAARLTVTGDITEIAFANVPPSVEMPTLTMSIQMDATGDHAVAEPTGITRWLQGTSWSMLNTSPGAKNVVMLFWDGADLCATMIDTGALRLPGYTLQFEANETLGVPFSQDEEVDLDSVIVQALDGGAADGDLEFQKNGTGPQSGTVAFSANDVLAIVRSGASNPAVVRIPSYAP